MSGNRNRAFLSLILLGLILMASGQAVGAERARAAKRSMQHLKLIVIDPGHGGDNVGALSYNGVYEKTITLAVALELKRQIEALCDATVVLTRDQDKSLSLEQRIQLANESQADLFLSLHANIAFNDKAEGAEILVLSEEAKEKEARKLTWIWVPQKGRLAAASDDSAAAVVTEMMQHGGHVASIEAGNFLLKRFAQHTKLPTRGVKEGAFSVLKGAVMAAMVMEMGFLSNPAEAKLLGDSAHQTKIARALAEAIVEYDTSLDSPKAK